jgi:hypothetical protein
MNRPKLILAIALIAAYGFGAIAFGWIFPGSSNDALGANVDAFYGAFAAVFLGVMLLGALASFVLIEQHDEETTNA